MSFPVERVQEEAESFRKGSFLQLNPAPETLRPLNLIPSRPDAFSTTSAICSPRRYVSQLTETIPTSLDHPLQEVWAKAFCLFIGRKPQ